MHCTMSEVSLFDLFFSKFSAANFPYLALKLNIASIDNDNMQLVAKRTLKKCYMTWIKHEIYLK